MGHPLSLTPSCKGVDVVAEDLRTEWLFHHCAPLDARTELKFSPLLHPIATSALCKLGREKDGAPAACEIKETKPEENKVALLSFIFLVLCTKSLGKLGVSGHSGKAGGSN